MGARLGAREVLLRRLPSRLGAGRREGRRCGDGRARRPPRGKLDLPVRRRACDRSEAVARAPRRRSCGRRPSRARETHRRHPGGLRSRPARCAGRHSHPQGLSRLPWCAEPRSLRCSRPVHPEVSPHEGSGARAHRSALPVAQLRAQPAESGAKLAMNRYVPGEAAPRCRRARCGTPRARPRT